MKKEDVTKPPQMIPAARWLAPVFTITLGFAFFSPLQIEDPTSKTIASIVSVLFLSSFFVWLARKELAFYLAYAAIGLATLADLATWLMPEVQVDLKMDPLVFTAVFIFNAGLHGHILREKAWAARREANPSTTESDPES